MPPLVSRLNFSFHSTLLSSSRLFPEDSISKSASSSRDVFILLNDGGTSQEGEKKNAFPELRSGRREGKHLFGLQDRVGRELLTSGVPEKRVL